MKKVLVKDITIPAGTVFSDAPANIAINPQCGAATIGLTRDTLGVIYYPITGEDEDLLQQWFVDLKEGSEPEDLKGNEIRQYSLEVLPAVKPEVRHKIEDLLHDEGFEIIGGGQNADMSGTDISFEGP